MRRAYALANSWVWMKLTWTERSRCFACAARDAKNASCHSAEKRRPRWKITGGCDRSYLRKVRARSARRRKLESPSSLTASRVRDASSGGRRGLASHSGVAGPRFTFHHAEIHARIHPSVDGSV